MATGTVGKVGSTAVLADRPSAVNCMRFIRVYCVCTFFPHFVDCCKSLQRKISTQPGQPMHCSSSGIPGTPVCAQFNMRWFWNSFKDMFFYFPKTFKCSVKVWQFSFISCIYAWFTSIFDITVCLPHMFSLLTFPHALCTVNCLFWPLVAVLEYSFEFARKIGESLQSDKIIAYLFKIWRPIIVH